MPSIIFFEHIAEIWQKGHLGPDTSYLLAAVDYEGKMLVWLSQSKQLIPTFLIPPARTVSHQPL